MCEKIKNRQLLEDSNVRILYQSGSFRGVNVIFLLHYIDSGTFFTCHCQLIRHTLTYFHRAHLPVQVLSWNLQFGYEIII